MNFATATPAQIDEARNDAMIVERETTARIAGTVVAYSEAHRSRKGTDYAKGAAKRGLTVADLLDRADTLVAEYAVALADAQAAWDAKHADDDYHYTLTDVAFVPSFLDAAEAGRSTRTYYGSEIDRIVANVATVREARATIAACDDEYDRRGGWARYWVVVSSANGKVHRSGCGSWRWTTLVSLAYTVSGIDDEGVVTTLDAGACTRCFADAPTEYTPAKAAEPAAPTVDADGNCLTRDNIVDGTGYRGTCGACDARVRRTGKDSARLRTHTPGQVA